MGELSKKLNLLKNGSKETAIIYSTTDEAGDDYVLVKVDGVNGYVALGDVDDPLATKGRLLKNGKIYAIKSEAIPPVTFNLVCKNVADESIIKTIKYKLPVSGEVYFNNQNAPSVAGFDFVSLEGITKTGVTENNNITAYYISNSVADRTRESWKRYYKDNTTITNVYLNTYNATNMYYMFYGCSSLKTITRLNTSKVTDMNRMFYECKNLASVPEMDVSNVADMEYMFYKCFGLKTVPKMNTSKVTDMNRMFQDCDSLISAPELDTRNVTNMHSMFAYCSKLESVPYMNTSKVKDMGYMFFLCSALKSLDWEIDMSSCTNCQSMLNGPQIAIKLKNVPRSLDLSAIGTTNYTVVNYI